MADRRTLLSSALFAGLYLPALAIGVWSPNLHGQSTRTDAATVSAADVAAAQHIEPEGALERLAFLRDERQARIWTDATPVATPAPAEASAEAPVSAGQPAPAPAAEQSPVAEAPQPAAAPQEERLSAASIAPAAPQSVLSNDQLIIYYGTPLSSGLGVLGKYSPEEAGQRVRDQAAVYDSLNGDRGAKPALDLIYSVVQSEPTANGMYIQDLPDDMVQRYIDVAEQQDLQLILDLQIGRSDPLTEVRKIERFLLNPRVHVAIDPEYAVGPTGVPIATPGHVSGNQLNDIQDYLSNLATANNLPPKIFVVHQFMEDTITEGEVTRDVDNVDLVLNMDAFGEIAAKAQKYSHFAERSYAHKDAFNLFLKQDERPMSEAEVLGLSPQPDAVFYQ